MITQRDRDTTFRTHKHTKNFKSHTNTLFSLQNTQTQSNVTKLTKPSFLENTFRFSLEHLSFPMDFIWCPTEDRKLKIICNWNNI